MDWGWGMEREEDREGRWKLLSVFFEGSTWLVDTASICGMDKQAIKAGEFGVLGWCAVNQRSYRLSWIHPLAWTVDFRMQLVLLPITCYLTN